MKGSYRNIREVGSAHFDDDCLFLIDSNDDKQLLEGIEYVARQCPSGKAIAMTEHFDLRSMIDCFHAGAHGYLVKTDDSLPLTASLRLAAAGRKVLPSEIVDLLDRDSVSSLLVAENGHSFKDAKLSPREVEVLCCLMAGYSNKVIARNLNVCEATVKVHVKAILRKLNVRNRTQAAIWASARGVPELTLMTDRGEARV